MTDGVRKVVQFQQPLNDIVCKFTSHKKEVVNAVDNIMCLHALVKALLFM